MTTLKEQPEREKAALNQWERDSRLRTVLKAWGHGPELIESFLGWGYVLVNRAEAVAPYREALREILDAWDKRATNKPIEQVQALIPAIIAARSLLQEGEQVAQPAELPGE